MTPTAFLITEKGVTSINHRFPASTIVLWMDEYAKKYAEEVLNEKLYKSEEVNFAEWLRNNFHTGEDSYTPRYGSPLYDLKALSNFQNQASYKSDYLYKIYVQIQNEK